ncbi:TetR/AcrR family transcriptional regulator [Pseudomonas sp. JH-2]|uniref:TetR/AcrR family transcriptional regulator n=1 Tax=Pseudomonas sp. JH-2 TaxID=3114998 RepID=UPI002E261EFB|nr:TetR/AcrR family transcriptional regulator [Pseudomonas sp. JH-2]
MSSRKPQPPSGAADGEAPGGSPTRNAKARSRTRAKLIRAAREVMGRQGIDATAIGEITERAELSLGSFYNYFTSKEEIARAVFIEDALALADLLDAEASNSHDIVERVGHNIRRTLRHALQDPMWGWFFIHSAHSINDLGATLGSRLVRDLRSGAQQGAFALADAEAAADCIIGGCLYLLRQILEGDRPAAAIDGAVAFFLLGLGVDKAQAGRVAHRPLEAGSGA